MINLLSPILRCLRGLNIFGFENVCGSGNAITVPSTHSSGEGDGAPRAFNFNCTEQLIRCKSCELKDELMLIREP